MVDPQSPYALKFGRAMKHLKELEALLRRYEGRQAHTAFRDRDADPNPRVWVVRAYLKKEPRENLSLVVGDVVHNLRASLDHLVSALVPRDRKRKGKMPVVREDIWAIDPETGEQFERFADDRTSFESATKGMDPMAIEWIRDMQPYKLAKANRAQHTLAVLNTLDNADKHYELTTIAHGIKDPVTTLRGPGFNLTHHGEGIAEDGGIVGTIRITPRELKTYIPDQSLVDHIIDYMTQPDPKVKVEVTGTPQVAIKVAGLKGYPPLPTAIDELMQNIWESYFLPLHIFDPLTD